MSYQPLKPAPNDFLDQSVNDIQTNFATSNTSFGKNHFPFDDATANNGKHKFVDMVNQTIPATAAGEGSFYTKQATSVGASTESDVFYTPDGSTNEYQMTRTITSKFGSFATNPGWTFLPGGLLLQYGKISVNAGGSFPVTFPVTFTNVPYSITLAGTRGTTNSSSIFVVQGSEATSGFSIYNTSGTSGGIVNCYWMAIGS